MELIKALAIPIAAFIGIELIIFGFRELFGWLERLCSKRGVKNGQNNKEG